MWNGCTAAAEWLHDQLRFNTTSPAQQQAELANA
jgi:hypothetical protein